MLSDSPAGVGIPGAARGLGIVNESESEVSLAEEPPKMPSLAAELGVASDEEDGESNPVTERKVRFGRNSGPSSSRRPRGMSQTQRAHQSQPESRRFTSQEKGKSRADSIPARSSIATEKENDAKSTHGRKSAAVTKAVVKPGATRPRVSAKAVVADVKGGVARRVPIGGARKA